MNKSSEEKLRKRGKFNPEDLIFYQNNSKTQLYRQLHSKTAAERSIAVHLLSKRQIEELELTNRLIQILIKEKSLYTKIEICLALQEGKEETAKLLIPYLGKIGENQHKKLPSRSSRKKSYPLPRDIIARTLAKMDTCISPLLHNELKNNDEHMLSELIDSIGFMTFYNNQLASKNHFNKLLNLYNKTENILIQWKLILSFSSFPINQSKAKLNSIIKENKHPLLVEEANRSLKIIG